MRRGPGPSPRFVVGWAGPGYRAELVDGAITKLLEFGVLDDETFARAWVESRDRARPRGERAIREELRLKGIDRGVMDTVLAERRADGATVDEDHAEVSVDRAAAERLIAKHARALARVADPRQAAAAGLRAARAERIRSRDLPRGGSERGGAARRR